MTESSELNTCSVEVLRKCPVVVVDWVDAVCTGGADWQTLDEVQEALKGGPSLVRSVGMLVANEASHIALLDTLILDGDAAGYVHVIPRGMVVNIIEVWNEQT